jgi:hypothetical protein
MEERSGVTIVDVKEEYFLYGPTIRYVRDMSHYMT